MDKKTPKPAKESFKISDIWLASALSLGLNRDPELIFEDGKVKFCFPFTAETLKMLHIIGSGELKFDYVSFSEKFKKLRFEMFSMKNKLGK